MNEPKAGETWLVQTPIGLAECVVVEHAGGAQHWRCVHGAVGTIDWRSGSPIRRIPTAEELAELERKAAEYDREREIEREIWRRNDALDARRRKDRGR